MKHKKIFWLDQYIEMENAAKKIAETRITSHPELQYIIFRYGQGEYRGKGELTDVLFEKIKEITVPRENSGSKYLEQNLFQ